MGTGTSVLAGTSPNYAGAGIDQIILTVKSGNDVVVMCVKEKELK
jgi:hypothetical protein